MKRVDLETLILSKKTLCHHRISRHHPEKKPVRQDQAEKTQKTQGTRMSTVTTDAGMAGSDVVRMLRLDHDCGHCEAKARGHRKDQPLASLETSAELLAQTSPNAKSITPTLCGLHIQTKLFPQTGTSPRTTGRRKPELLRPSHHAINPWSADRHTHRGNLYQRHSDCCHRNHWCSGSFSPQSSQYFQTTFLAPEWKTSYSAHSSTFWFSAIQAHVASVQLHLGAFSCDSTPFWKRECPLIFLKMRNSHHVPTKFNAMTDDL